MISMECRDLREHISALIDGEVPPAEARRTFEHLEGCAECRDLERKMRVVGIGVARTAGVAPADFREKLYARMEAEDLLPRRRSLFVFSLRWAAVPLAAAAALALFQLVSPEKGKDAVSPLERLPHVARRAPVTEAPAPAAPVARIEKELSPEEREIIAYLDVLEDPSILDAPGDVDEMEIFTPSVRSRG
jgi:anti-sigma factor RsiW